MRAAERERIRHAVEASERLTSAEIVVSIAPPFLGPIERGAELAFERLGVARTRQRNGVLFFIVPSRRKFVIRADVGVYDRTGQPFWEELAGTISTILKNTELTGGIIDSLHYIGRQLGAFYPHDPGMDLNELPDAPR